MPIAGLILAAGGSTRMKTPKQLLPWGNNSLIQHVIQTAKQSKLDALYLVLGSASEVIKEHLKQEDLTIIENDEWKKGMGTSIASGIEALAGDPSFEACMILLADQPFVTGAYLNQMIAACEPDTIIASDYNGKAGVPCIFPRRFFPELLGLDGDAGARKLLDTLREHVQLLRANADLRDIDTPETYQKYMPK